MKRELCILTLTILASSGTAQTIFGPGDGDNYDTGSAIGHGGAVSPYLFSSSIFPGGDPSLTVAKINSVTVTDLITTDGQGLSFVLHNGSEFAILMRAITTDANFSGDYTFVDDDSFMKLSEVAAGLGSNDVVPSGTYQMEGGFGIFGDFGNFTDLDHFIGTSIHDGWTLQLSNGSLTNTGSFSGWEITATARAVPEPATLTMLGLAGAALIRRRRK